MHVKASRHIKQVKGKKRFVFRGTKIENVQRKRGLFLACRNISLHTVYHSKAVIFGLFGNKLQPDPKSTLKKQGKISTHMEHSK